MFKKILVIIFLIFLFYLLRVSFSDDITLAQELNLGYDQGPCCYCSGPFGSQCVYKPTNVSTCAVYGASQNIPNCYSVSCDTYQGCPLIQLQPPSTPPLTLILQIPIPGLAQTITIDGDTIGTYISAVYKFFVGALAIIAVVMIMIGGFQWLMAAGSAEKVSQAKETIFGAIIGLVLALTSYLLLYTINPNLVQFKTLIVTYVTPNQLGAGSTLISLQHQLGDGYEFYADLNKYENTWLPQTAAALDRVIDKLQEHDPPITLHIESGSRGLDKQKELYAQNCGSNNSCSNFCPTACNPYNCGKDCSHANAIDVKTSMYSAADYQIVQETLKSEGFCKYPAEDNHFENPKWTGTCSMDY